MGAVFYYGQESLPSPDLRRLQICGDATPEVLMESSASGSSSSSSAELSSFVSPKNWKGVLAVASGAIAAATAVFTM